MRSEKGFSILELALVLIISGITMVSFYSAIFYVTNLGRHGNNTQIIRTGISEHIRIHGVYPCPARLGLPAGDPDYYTPDCTIAPIAGSVSGQVLIGTVPITVLQQAMGCGEAPIALPDNMLDVFKKKLLRVKDVVLLNGAAPSLQNENLMMDQGICLSGSDIADTQGNKILYAVMKSQTETINFNPNAGNILIHDINDMPATQKLQPFVVLSHGEDGKGAYNASSGTIGIACGAALGRDQENCDNDAIFRDSSLYSIPGATYYDDYLDFSLAGVSREDSFWSWKDSGVANTRDIIFSSTTRAMIGDTKDLTAVTVSDLLVIGGGDIRSAEDLITDSEDVLGVKVGGDIFVGNNVTATGGEVRGDKSVVSPKFCYDPPLVAANCL